MPEISLRAYSRDIDEMIEREKLEEAIAHCRHILQTYPKHLETYRLLGKAYLEAKRYGDAADIFQRVLSAVPDDFVSHIGMSIVREDEGNLDAAIWHMERAFETNPSNPAIQQEMKRLIGRRDGLEPHKVRLTRGALARMYAHGELYPQAIAELRSALQEDPDRPDLQVLLADMFWRTDQSTEATSVANQVLEKLPYCMKANRILAANLQAKERVEEAALYHRRLAGLDPYAAFVESAMADPATIEASAVSIERFDWQPGKPLPDGGPAQPGWAATLGMEMKQSRQRDQEGRAELPQTGPLPSWLEPGEPPPFETSGRDAQDEQQEVDEPHDEVDSLEPEWLAEESDASERSQELDESVSEDDFMRELGETGDIPPEASEVAPDSSTEIPDWMQEAGWSEATGEAVDQPVSFSDAELRSLEAGELPPDEPPTAEEDSELAPAELPDWVQGIAPEPGADDEQAEASAGPPEWLAAGDDEEDIELTSGEDEFQLSSEAADTSSEEMELPESSAEEIGAGGSEAPDEEPDMRFPAADSGSEDLPTWIAEEAPGATDTIVTWLGSQGQERKATDQDQLDELPEWMKDTGPLVDKGDAGIGISSPSAEPGQASESARAGSRQDEPPDWMEGILDDDDEQPAPMAEPSPDDEPATVSEVSAEDQPTPVSEASTGDGSPDLPSWLSAVAEAAAAEESDDGGGKLPPEAEVEFEQPDKSDQAVEPTMQASDQAPETEAEREEEQLAPAEPPDWLSEAMGGPSGSVDADELLAESAESDGKLADVEPPSWMDDETDEAEDWLAPEEIEAAEESFGETPDWLKGLAEEGADETASSRAADAPDWLRAIAEPDSQAAQPADEIEPADQEFDIPPDDLTEEPPPSAAPKGEPVGTDEPAAVPTPSAEMETPPHGFEAPDWLQGIDEAPESPAAGDGAPEWLGGIGDESEAAPAAADGAPDWLGEIGQEPESTPAGADAPDWLSGLGDESQDSTAAVEPETESDAGPDTTFPGVPEAPSITPPADVDDEVISWLEDLAAAQEQTEIPESIYQAADADAEPPVMEQREIPEEPEEGLEWLEQLAEQRGLDVDVSLPEAPADARPEPPTVQPEEPAAAEPASADDSAPDWLTRMATQPLPKLEPESGSDTADDEPAESPPIDPGAETIKKRADELWPDMPAVPGATEADEVPTTEDDMPEWLIQAASQEAAEPAETTAPATQAEPPAAPEQAATEPAAASPVQPPEQAPTEPAAAPAGEQAPQPPAEAEQPAPAAETAQRVPPSAEPAEVIPSAVEGARAAEPAPEPEPQEAAPEAEVREDLPMAAEPAAPTPPAEPAPPEVVPTEQVPAAAEPAAPTPPAEPAPPEAVTTEQVPAAAEPAPEPEPLETAPEAEVREDLPMAAEPAAPTPPAEPAPPEVVPTEQVPAAAEPAAPTPPAEPAKPGAARAKPDREQALEQSRQALAAGDTERALELYGGLIKRKTSLNDVIEDLRMAVDRTPDNAVLWQALGDAYMKNDQSAEAIDAYRKGMEVA